MHRVIGGLRYDTDKATVIADDIGSNGSCGSASGRRTYLYRTNAGRYFAHHETTRKGERSTIEPLDQLEAVRIYESFNDPTAMDFEEAFPGVPVEDA